MKLGQILAATTLVLSIGAAGAVSAGAQTPEAAGAAGCKVTVDRTQAANTFAVQRQMLDDGDCVCYVTTGPDTQSAATEGRVANIVNSKDCSKKIAPIAAGGPGIPVFAAAAAVSGGVLAVIATTGHHHHDRNDSTGG